MDKHTEYKEDLAAYALGALDDNRVVALQAHVRSCKSCAADLAAYSRITGGLLHAIPPKAPPAALRRRLQQRLRQEQRSASQARRQWSWGQLAVAAAVMALIALNVVSLWQVNQVRRDLAEQEARTTAAQTAIAMLAYPGTQMQPFDQNGIAGSLLVDKQRNLLAVFAWNLPPTSVASVYQVWLVDAQGNRTSGGFLTSEVGYPFAMAVIQPTGPLSNFNSVGVTIEPLGGSPGPTGPKVFSVSF